MTQCQKKVGTSLSLRAWPVYSPLPSVPALPCQIKETISASGNTVKQKRKTTNRTIKQQCITCSLDQLPTNKANILLPQSGCCWQFWVHPCGSNGCRAQQIQQTASRDLWSCINKLKLESSFERFNLQLVSASMPGQLAADPGAWTAAINAALRPELWKQRRDRAAFGGTNRSNV